MHISHLDVIEVAAYALGGFVLFGAYSLGNLVSRKKIGTNLPVETRAVQKYERTRALLSEVHRSTKDEVGFIRLVNAIDRIFVLHDSLLGANLQTDVMDPYLRKKVFYEYMTIKKELVIRLREEFASRQSTTPQQVVDFEALLTNIVLDVYEHMKHIWLLTDKCLQH